MNEEQEKPNDGLTPPPEREDQPRYRLEMSPLERKVLITLAISGESETLADLARSTDIDPDELEGVITRLSIRGIISLTGEDTTEEVDGSDEIIDQEEFEQISRLARSPEADEAPAPEAGEDKETESKPEGFVMAGLGAMSNGESMGKDKADVAASLSVPDFSIESEAAEPEQKVEAAEEETAAEEAEAEEEAVEEEEVEEEEAEKEKEEAAAGEAKAEEEAVAEEAEEEKPAEEKEAEEEKAAAEQEEAEKEEAAQEEAEEEVEEEKEEAAAGEAEAEEEAAEDEEAEEEEAEEEKEEAAAEEEEAAQEEVEEKAAEEEAPIALDLDSLKALLASMEEMHYYQVLEIDPQDDRRKIRRAYYRLARQYHPDQHQEIEDYDVLEGLADIFNYITLAYETLHSNKRRRLYDRTIPDVTGARETEEEEALSMIFDESGDEEGAAPKVEADAGEDEETEEPLGWSFYEAALADFQMGDYKAAELNFKLAASMDPNRREYQEGLKRTANILNEQVVTELKKEASRLEEDRRFREAITTLSRAVKVAPDDADLHYSLARIRYLKTMERERAEEDLARALESDPGHIDSLLLLGRVQAVNGDTLGAISTFKHVLGLEPDHPKAQQALELFEK